MDKHTIGSRIRMLRDRRGLTQEALAELVRRYVPDGKSVPRNSKHSIQTY